MWEKRGKTKEESREENGRKSKKLKKGEKRREKLRIGEKRRNNQNPLFKYCDQSDLKTKRCKINFE